MDCYTVKDLSHMSYTPSASAADTATIDTPNQEQDFSFSRSCTSSKRATVDNGTIGEQYKGTSSGAHMFCENSAPMDQYNGLRRNGLPPPTKRRKIDPEARFGSKETNVFMLMEETEIPGGDDESVTEEDVLLIIPSDLPYPDDFLLDPEDTRYLKIFLDKGPIMVRPLGLFFPCACERIFRASIEYSRLRQAIVALSMDFVDSPPVLSPRLSRYLLPFHTKPGDPSKRTTAYARDSEVFAIFLIITLTLKHLSTTKDVPSLRRHVRHLYKLFRSAQADVTRGKRDPLSPLLFYIWRQIMRINVTLALGVTHIPSCFPPPALHPNGKIATGYGPVGELLGSAPREFEQWTLAQLELDDIGNRISRMHLRANAVRSGKQSDEVDERELVLNTELLVRLNDRWRQNPVIQVAEYLEQLHRQTPPDADSKEKHFLSYPELRFRNPLYACLLLAHYAIRISSSFVLDQRIGPQTPDRLEAAIEICRIYAALGGNHPVGSLTCLASIWWAGLVFDETTHPNEAKWVRERLADPIHCGQGLRYLEHLNVVWRKTRRSKSWEVWANFPEEVGDSHGHESK